MKKVLVFVIAIMVISAPAFAVNIVQNGDFSSGETGWVRWNAPRGSYTWDVMDAMGDGDPDGVLTSSGTSFGWYQELTVIPGESYTIDLTWMGNGGSAWSEVLLFNDDGRSRLDQLDSGDPVGHGFVIAKYDSWGLGSYPFGPIAVSAMDPSQLLIGTRTVVATGNLMIVGLKCGDGGGGCITAFDNVVVDGPLVPEPASMLALAAGLGGLLIRRRR